MEKDIIHTLVKLEIIEGKSNVNLDELSKLLLDNYDSFTYNIYQIVAENFPDTIVCRNDEINIQKIKELNL